MLGVYRSCNSDFEVLVEQLQSIISLDKSTIVGGDFNLDIFQHKSNVLTDYLSSVGFKQVVSKSTHIEGGLIDHCYIRLVVFLEKRGER